VREYVDLYYPDEASLAQEVAAQVWFDSLHRPRHQG
jgi:hypothetical protein